MPLVHHELCFGCGQTNLFGLLLEVERTADDLVAGRCFIKQDHQGPGPGTAHPGIVAAALVEAMSLAGGERRPLTLEVRFEEPVPVGSFLELDASANDATACLDGRPVASARATWG